MEFKSIKDVENYYEVLSNETDKEYTVLQGPTELDETYFIVIETGAFHMKRHLVYISYGDLYDINGNKLN